MRTTVVCTEKQRNALLNTNRLLIYGFGMLGLFYDFTWAYAVSMTLWVWLPNCIKLERFVFSLWIHHLSPFEEKSHPVNQQNKFNFPSSKSS